LLFEESEENTSVAGVSGGSQENIGTPWKASRFPLLTAGGWAR